MATASQVHRWKPGDGFYIGNALKLMGFPLPLGSSPE
jgi:hypothetical protein